MVMNDEIRRQQERAAAASVAQQRASSLMQKERSKLEETSLSSNSGIPKPPARPAPISASSNFKVTDTRKASQDPIALTSPAASGNEARFLLRGPAMVGAASSEDLYAATSTPTKDSPTPLLSLVHSPVTSHPPNEGAAGNSQNSSDNTNAVEHTVGSSDTAPTRRTPTHPSGFKFTSTSSNPRGGPMLFQKPGGRVGLGGSSSTGPAFVSAPATVLATWARGGFGGVELQRAHSLSISTDSLIDLASGTAMAAGRRRSHANPNQLSTPTITIEEGEQEFAAGGGANAAAIIHDERHSPSRHSSQNDVSRHSVSVGSSVVASALAGARLSSRDLDGLLLEAPVGFDDDEDDEEEEEVEEDDEEDYEEFSEESNA